MLVLPLNVSIFRSSVDAGFDVFVFWLLLSSLLLQTRSSSTFCVCSTLTSGFDVLFSVKAGFDVLFSVCYCVVSGCKRRVPAHSTCAQY